MDKPIFEFKVFVAKDSDSGFNVKLNTDMGQISKYFSSIGEFEMNILNTFTYAFKQFIEATEAKKIKE
jgi:hypothetical protein